jgi:hypothetical protein
MNNNQEYKKTPKLECFLCSHFIKENSSCLISRKPFSHFIIGCCGYLIGKKQPNPNKDFYPSIMGVTILTNKKETKDLSFNSFVNPFNKETKYL